MNIVVNGAYALIRHIEKKWIADHIRDILSVKAPFYARKHGWDGIYRFAHQFGKILSVPMGFIWHVVDYAVGCGEYVILHLDEATKIEFEPGDVLNLIDRQKRKIDFSAVFQRQIFADHGGPPDRLTTYILYPHQKLCVQAMLNVGHGVIKSTTASGKTGIMAAAIHAFDYPRTLVLFSKTDLMYQTADVFRRELNMDVGVIGDDQFAVGDVTVGTIQTIHQRHATEDVAMLKKTTELLMFDEVHLLSGSNWYKQLMGFKTRLRFGFSATPFSQNAENMLRNMRLMGAAGPIIAEIGAQEMIDSGVIAKPIIRMIEFHHDPLTAEFDWSSAYDYGVVKNKGRNDIIIMLARSYIERGSTVLIPTTRIEHARILASGIGNEACIVWGKIDPIQRKVIYDECRHGNVKCLVGTVIGVGLDIPHADVLINAAAGKSDQATIQKMGRVLRRKEHNKAIVIDIFDRNNHFLERHAKMRLRAYEREGYEVNFNEQHSTQI